ncbi:hypothetical protein IscW_ISCW001133 [Ixodes scapularis]|uniref:Uncharacterized protein n=1 Tax=Ixodes scapularis TaxID=6945 RepID=B7P567_IXOSC|nr:hypothetical protein IscW_ISCW001133 [Ixodes scapularis]|eukprot:XP_002407064.1 hypothetical protein IscW_ISCW001133 [Ixodes scapularis]
MVTTCATPEWAVLPGEQMSEQEGGTPAAAGPGKGAFCSTAICYLAVFVSVLSDAGSHLAMMGTRLDRPTDAAAAHLGAQLSSRLRSGMLVGGPTPTRGTTRASGYLDLTSLPPLVRRTLRIGGRLRSRGLVGSIDSDPHLDVSFVS